MTLTSTSLIERVAKIFGVSPKEITGPSRVRHIVVARQAAVWALRQRYPDMSCCALSAAVGRRDHSTALWALAAVEKRARKSPDYARKLAEIDQVDAPAQLISVELDRTDPRVDTFLQECGGDSLPFCRLISSIG